MKYNPLFLLVGGAVALLGFVIPTRKSDETQTQNSDAQQASAASSVPPSAASEPPTPLE